MFSDVLAVHVHNVSKQYLLFDRPEDRLKQMIVPRLDRLAGRPPKSYYRAFCALSGVSFVCGGRGEDRRHRRPQRVPAKRPSCRSSAASLQPTQGRDVTKAASPRYSS